MDLVLGVLLALGLLGLPTALARASRGVRPVIIAIAASAGAYIGLTDPLWGHRPAGSILLVTFFLVLATIGAAVARDGRRVRAGLLILAITGTAYVLVSVVASAR